MKFETDLWLSATQTLRRVVSQNILVLIAKELKRIDSKFCTVEIHGDEKASTETTWDLKLSSKELVQQSGTHEGVRCFEAEETCYDQLTLMSIFLGLTCGPCGLEKNKLGCAFQIRG